MSTPGHSVGQNGKRVPNAAVSKKRHALCKTVCDSWSQSIESGRQLLDLFMAPLAFFALGVTKAKSFCVALAFSEVSKEDDFCA